LQKVLAIATTAPQAQIRAKLDKRVKDASLNIMGESKRRREILGEQYGKDTRRYSWFPLTRGQTDQFIKITTTGAWLGIGIMIAVWVTVRFIGPSVGWWNFN